MIVAMTTDHQLPQIFGRTNKHGVPYIAVIVAWLFGPLAYLSKPQRPSPLPSPTNPTH